MISMLDKQNASMTVNELKKYRHKKKILRILYKGIPLSATEISKNMGISLPTVIALLNDLISLGFVETFGIGVSTGGRKPALYSLSTKSLFVISCDMGRYKAKMAVFNSRNERITPVKLIDTNIDDNDLTEKLYAAAQELTAGNGISWDKVVGMSVDMPGLVDSEAGINYTIKNVRKQDIGKQLEKKSGIHVYIDNDARIQAYGEYMFGKARQSRNAIIVNWSWGVGLGMILNGKLYGGSTGFAGELSHIQMVDDGDLCICGKRGCLETIASSNTIMKLARHGVLEGRISQLTEMFRDNLNEMTPDDVIRVARAGDEMAISILNKIGFSFGRGLSILIQLLNPEIIILGGPISRANQFVLTPIQQALNKYCLEKVMANTKIVISEIDEDSGLLGGAAMVYQHLFSD